MLKDVNQPHIVKRREFLRTAAEVTRSSALCAVAGAAVFDAAALALGWLLGAKDVPYGTFAALGAGFGGVAGLRYAADKRFAKIFDRIVPLPNPKRPSPNNRISVIEGGKSPCQGRQDYLVPRK